jgi:hypothetical protein
MDTLTYSIILGVIAVLAVAALIVSLIAVFEDPTGRTEWTGNQVMSGRLTVTGVLDAARLTDPTAERLTLEGPLVGQSAQFAGDVQADDLHVKTLVAQEDVKTATLHVTDSVTFPPIVGAQAIQTDSLDVKNTTATRTLVVAQNATTDSLTANSITTTNLTMVGTFFAPVVQAGNLQSLTVDTKQLAVQGGPAVINGPLNMLDGSPAVLYDPVSTKSIILQNGDVMLDGVLAPKGGTVVPTLTVLRTVPDITANQMFMPYSPTDWYTSSMNELVRIVEFSDTSSYLYSSVDAKTHMEFIPPNTGTLTANPGLYLSALPGDFTWPAGGRYIDYPVSVLPDTVADRGNYAILKTPGRYHVQFTLTLWANSPNPLPSNVSKMRPVVLQAPVLAGPLVRPNFGWTLRLVEQSLFGPWFGDSLSDLGSTVSGIIQVDSAPQAVVPLAQRPFMNSAADQTTFLSLSSVFSPNATSLRVSYLGPVN